jgi:adenylosuccinate synthase
MGEKLQAIERKFGVTTSRPRRCDWPDLVMVWFAASIKHATNFVLSASLPRETDQVSMITRSHDHTINFTKLDVLDEFETIKVATGHTIDSRPLNSFPTSLEQLSKTNI